MDYNRLKGIIKGSRISLKELAKKVEMSEVGFHQALANKTLKVETLEKIAEVLNIDVAEFFTDFQNRLLLQFEINSLKIDYEKLALLYIRTMENYLFEKYRKEQDRLTFTEYNNKINSELYSSLDVITLFEKSIITDSAYISLWEKYKPKE